MHHKIVTIMRKFKWLDDDFFPVVGGKIVHPYRKNE